jgi:hypothetical protein
MSPSPRRSTKGSEPGRAPSRTASPARIRRAEVEVGEEPLPHAETIGTEAVQRSIAETVGGLGSKLRRATPKALVAGVVAAAFWPVVTAALSPGGIVAAASGLTALVGTVGQGFIQAFVQRIATSRREPKGTKPPTENQIREDLEREVLRKLEEGTKEGAALRADVSRLLESVRGVQTALEAASDDVKAALAEGLAELGTTFNEFRWMLDEVQRVLADVQATQAEQLALQRTQLDLQREQLTKINMLIESHSRVRRRRRGLRKVATPRQEIEEFPADVSSPYKGLQAFQSEDADLFFGREELVATLLARLAEAPLLAVVGPSGSGKSSVVRAGLIPAIWRGSVPGSGNWHVLTLTPGHHPMEELGLRVSSLSRVAPSSLVQDLRSDPRSLELALRQLFLDAPEGRRLVLFIDQFEEVFTLCRDEVEREGFIASLLHAVRAHEARLVVILAMRADFYGRCSAYPEFAAALQGNQVLVGPMSEKEFREAIEGPAKVAGLDLEPSLVEMIVTDVAGEPGALPLFSQALLETWKRRRGWTLTLQGYAESGGVREAIANTAETAYRDRLTPAQQPIARNIFLRLIELGEGTEDTRRRVALDEIVSEQEDATDVRELLSVLADERLVTTSEESVELAHEALITHWPTLRAWLDEDRAGHRVHRHLTEASQDWLRLERDPGALYRGGRLAAADEWANDHPSGLNPLEREFLQASRAFEQSELAAGRRRNRRLRQLVATLAAGLTLAVVFGVLAVRQTSIANRERESAEQERRTAQEQTRLASSRGLAAASDSLRDSRPDLSLLLAIEANRLAPTTEGKGSLMSRGYETNHVVRFLAGHSDAVSSVAFSPDGTTLASGSFDRTIILWDVASRRQIGKPLTGHSGIVRAVAFSPDGTTVASGGFDRTIILWDVASRRQIGEPLTGHTDRIDGVAFSPDGTTLASGSLDHTIILWPHDVEVLSTRLCDIVGRNLTESEWATFLPNEPYRKTCPQWPLGS